LLAWWQRSASAPIDCRLIGDGKVDRRYRLLRQHTANGVGDCDHLGVERASMIVHPCLSIHDRSPGGEVRGFMVASLFQGSRPTVGRALLARLMSACGGFCGRAKGSASSQALSSQAVQMVRTMTGIASLTSAPAYWLQRSATTAYSSVPPKSRPARTDESLLFCAHAGLSAERADVSEAEDMLAREGSHADG
jgi:hypothetical protein